MEEDGSLEYYEAEYITWNGVNNGLAKKALYHINTIKKSLSPEDKAIVAKKEEVKKKLDDVKADLADDGMLNHSNDPKKKSPGRKKKGLFGRLKKNG